MMWQIQIPVYTPVDCMALHEPSRMSMDLRYEHNAANTSLAMFIQNMRQLSTLTSARMVGWQLIYHNVGMHGS